ncbi:FAD-binding oxidoreductase [Breoghania sp.]|uniref:NAD(P)/FAD-dependent oxidoreductase n=1 Tax=Breoghania sp. TaxID=2065378 RepID=UPI002629E9EA|nr:FAD-binding oxidoreductase [Breoghania sp.]MDJ0931336.1 FAD-binding oxidoreductase [Breoghania sp.]
MPLYSSHADNCSRPIGNYWHTTVELEPDLALALEGDQRAEFAVVGGGFTGLNAALQLATEHGADVALLEAGNIGWGASGRNGGFCCVGGSKRSLSDLVRHFGHKETFRFLDCQMRAIDHVRNFLDTHHIDANTHSDGELSLAHRKKAMHGLEADAAQLRKALGIDVTLHSKDELEKMGVAGPEFFGGATLNRGFALNPLKYTLGLTKAAKTAGARIHARSSVIRIDRKEGGWCLETAQGRLHARRLIMVTNSYLEEDLPGAPFSALKGRLLPVLSSVLVTRPLTAEEMAAQGWTSHQMSYDTRRLLNYFRLMPDGRFLFGMRGGMNTTPRDDMEMGQDIMLDFFRIFPTWSDVEVPHIWSGFVCMASDLNPVGPLDGAPDAYTALAYHGNEVAMGSLCGVAVADMAAGAVTSSDLPVVLRGPLKRFPIPRLRKTYLKVAYRWYGLRDEKL